MSLVCYFHHFSFQTFSFLSFISFSFFSCTLFSHIAVTRRCSHFSSILTCDFYIFLSFFLSLTVSITLVYHSFVYVFSLIFSASLQSFVFYFNRLVFYHFKGQLPSSVTFRCSHEHLLLYLFLFIVFCSGCVLRLRYICFPFVFSSLFDIFHCSRDYLSITPLLSFILFLTLIVMFCFRIVCSVFVLPMPFILFLFYFFCLLSSS